MKELTEQECLAKASGLFDGEGCVSIGKWNRGTSYALQLTVSITNTDLRMLLWMQENFGGHIYPDKSAFKHGNFPVWHWRLYSNKASKFLKLILPYLLTKYDQAETAIVFQDNRIHGRKSSEPEVELVLRELVCSLNQQEFRSRE